MAEEIYGFDESKSKVTLKSGAGITVGEDGTIGHTNEVEPKTSYYGSATKIPRLQTDENGHITKLGYAEVYPPTTPGEAGQVWTSNGDGVGKWAEPADSGLKVSKTIQTYHSFTLPMSAVNTSVTNIKSSLSSYFYYPTHGYTGYVNSTTRKLYYDRDNNQFIDDEFYQSYATHKNYSTSMSYVYRVPIHNYIKDGITSILDSMVGTQVVQCSEGTLSYSEAYLLLAWEHASNYLVAQGYPRVSATIDSDGYLTGYGNLPTLYMLTTSSTSMSTYTGSAWNYNFEVSILLEDRSPGSNLIEIATL